MPHRGLEPASVLRLAFQSDALPTELSPLPEVQGQNVVGQITSKSRAHCWKHLNIFSRQMTLTVARKKCAFCVQMLGQRLAILSEVCVSQTSLKLKLSRPFVISSRTILNPNFLRLIPVFSSTLEAPRRTPVRCSGVPGRVATTRWSLQLWTVCHTSIA